MRFTTLRRGPIALAVGLIGLSLAVVACGSDDGGSSSSSSGPISSRNSAFALIAASWQPTRRKLM